MTASAPFGRFLQKFSVLGSCRSPWYLDLVCNSNRFSTCSPFFVKPRTRGSSPMMGHTQHILLVFVGYGCHIILIIFIFYHYIILYISINIGYCITLAQCNMFFKHLQHGLLGTSQLRLRQWALFELCGPRGLLRCQLLEPLRFASASPLMQELRRKRGKAGTHGWFPYVSINGTQIAG